MNTLNKFSSLTHYTNNIDKIIGILRNGFKYNYLNEVLPFVGFPGSVYAIKDVIRFNKKDSVVCFCDIPFKYIDDHAKQYGGYGIGINKKWCMEKGITPVRYFHHNTPDLQDVGIQVALAFNKVKTLYNMTPLQLIIKELRYKGVIKNFTEEDLKNISYELKQILDMFGREYENAMKYVTAQVEYLRAYEGKWIDRTTNKETDRIFYYEHEWRAIQPTSKPEYLEFPIDSIEYIIVSKSEEKEMIKELHLNEINNKVYLLSELKKLNND